MTDVPDVVRAALAGLFDDPEAPLRLLGGDLPDLDDPSTPAQDRLRELRDTLHDHLVALADQAHDDPAAVARLRAEATGILIALRELGTSFPEI